MVTIVVFGLTVSGSLLLSGSIALSLFHSTLQLWPPPGRDSWQYRLTWSTTLIFVVGTLGLGVLDWGSMSFPGQVRFGLGVPLLIGGLGLALWAVRSLGMETSLGLGGEMVRQGPYRFSRNPQYVGDILLIVGYILMSSSWMVLIPGVIGGLWFVLAPFAEESWLKGKYGQEYERYLEETPRFL